MVQSVGWLAEAHTVKNYYHRLKALAVILINGDEA